MHGEQLRMGQSDACRFCSHIHHPLSHGQAWPLRGLPCSEARCLLSRAILLGKHHIVQKA